MDIDKFNSERIELNNRLMAMDPFFSDFGNLDNNAYADGEIPKKYKELTGLAISIFSKCEDCIRYHLQSCQQAGCSRKEIIESIKIALIGGGSVLFPWARKTVRLMDRIGFK